MLSHLIRKIVRELGLHHPATLEVEYELAFLLAQCGRNLHALKSFKYLLEVTICLIVCGSSHLKNASSHVIIAKLYLRLGDHRLAMALVHHTGLIIADHDGLLLRNNQWQSLLMPTFR